VASLKIWEGPKNWGSKAYDISQMLVILFFGNTASQSTK